MTLELIASCISAGATVVYVYYTYKILKNNEKTLLSTNKQIDNNNKLVEINNNQFRESYRPIISLGLANDESLVLLRLKNEGNRTAYDVQISCKDIDNIINEDVNSYKTCIKQMCNNVMVIPPQVSWDLSICTGKHLSNIKPQILHFIISYKGLNETYTESIEIDLESFNWIRIHHPLDELKNISYELSKSNQELKKMNSNIHNND